VRSVQRLRKARGPATPARGPLPAPRPQPGPGPGKCRPAWAPFGPTSQRAILAVQADPTAIRSFRPNKTEAPVISTETLAHFSPLPPPSSSPTQWWRQQPVADGSHPWRRRKDGAPEQCHGNSLSLILFSSPAFVFLEPSAARRRKESRRRDELALGKRMTVPLRHHSPAHARSQGCTRHRRAAPRWRPSLAARTRGRASRRRRLFQMPRGAAEKAARRRSYAETARAHYAEPVARLPVDLGPSPRGSARSLARWRYATAAREPR
jgi:hypothetical protein